MTEEERRPEKRALRKEMPFLEHLEELRSVLFQVAVAVMALAVASWFVSRPVLDFVTRPVGKLVGELVFLGPTEAFTLRIKVALLTGLFVALPFVLFKVWGFVAPGLFTSERRSVLVVVVGSTLLFLAGSAFGFFILMPIALGFLLGFGTDYLTPMISAGNYFAFATKVCLALGIVFQLPLVVSLLTWVGLLDPRWLLRNWRYAILAIAAVSALFTPPDIASQFLMSVPVIGLYFFSVLLSVVIDRRRKREREEKQREEGEDGEENGS